MSVNVYLPLGKPVTVKVTPDTPILQILTEACRKKNLNPDEYDLKYHKQILDVNTIFRYTQVAHNSKLDLVERKTPRTASNVKVCVQLENRDRKNGEFLASVNIKKILSDLDVEYNAETAILNYMQREIHSKDFETVTLLSLGLGSGSALFRLMHRDPERPREQAHVYVPSTPKVSKIENDDLEQKPAPKPIQKKTFDPISAIKSEKGIEHKSGEEPAKNESQGQNKSAEETCSAKVCEPEKKDTEKPMEVEVQNEENQMAVVEEKPLEEPQISYLDIERQALLFNQAGAQSMPQMEIPDEFFDVTVKDIRIMHADMQKLNEKLKDSPLMTEKLRNLEKEKTILGTMHKYKKAVVRIYFPNQLVLQGIFRPLELVQQVKEFVKNYLDQPEADFSLYTTPPRYDLDSKKSLLDENLVPSAKVYYSGASDLKPEIKLKLTDPSAATYAAAKTRLTTTRSDAALVTDDSAGTSQPQQQLQQPASQQQPHYQDYQPRQPQKPTSDKVPKWFKPLKK